MDADQLDRRVEETARSLRGYDVIRWQEKLTGRSFEPAIEIVLLRWSKPHGVKVQGQTFLQSGDYNTATTVRIAAHEMLHPPFPMDGPAARAAMAVLERDALVMRIVREHDPKWGYTTLEGLLNEDVCEALDQLISEALGVARSVDGLAMVLLGGVHSLTGPVAGAAVFTLLQDEIARASDYWRAALGAAVLVLVLAFPHGLAGALAALRPRGRVRP